MVSKKPEKQPNLTIRTVAIDAGVSVAAVSKVLRGAYGVSDSLRKNVMESIDRLGYRPSTAARGMRGKTYTVGILLPDFHNPFFPEVVEGIQDVMGPSNYKEMIGVGHGQSKIESPLIETMIDNRMDGVIVVSPRLAGDLLARFARQIPMVVIGHHEPSADTFDTINSNDELGAMLATKALLDKGYDSIEMLTVAKKEGAEFDVVQSRAEGFQSVLKAAGLPARIHRMRESPELLEEDLNAFLDRSDLPRAVFCWSDLYAITLINIATTRGIRVPENFAIVGYDNNPVAQLPMIDLASIDQDGRRLGQMAADALLTRIRGRRLMEHAIVDPMLIERSSLGR